MGIMKNVVRFCNFKLCYFYKKGNINKKYYLQDLLTKKILYSNSHSFFTKLKNKNIIYKNNIYYYKYLKIQISNFENDLLKLSIKNNDKFYYNKKPNIRSGDNILYCSLSHLGFKFKASYYNFVLLDKLDNKIIEFWRCNNNKFLVGFKNDFTPEYIFIILFILKIHKINKFKNNITKIIL
jgi:hypothetical protein